MIISLSTVNAGILHTLVHVHWYVPYSNSLMYRQFSILIHYWSKECIGISD